MKKRWSVLAIAIVLSGVIVFGVSRATAQQMSHHRTQMRGQLNAGKTGEATFSQAILISDRALPRGSYRFVHRTLGDEHFMVFTQTARPWREFGEIKCQVEALPEKVSRTAITTMDDGGARRVTRIEVAGENLVHVF